MSDLARIIRDFFWFTVLVSFLSPFFLVFFGGGFFSVLTESSAEFCGTVRVPCCVFTDFLGNGVRLRAGNWFFFFRGDQWGFDRGKSHGFAIRMSWVAKNWHAFVVRGIERFKLAMVFTVVIK